MSRYPLVAACVLLLLPAISVFAADEDGGLWTSTGISRAFGDDLSADLTLQLRFDDDIGRLERTLLRPSVSYRAAHGQILTLGYDAHFIDAPRDIVEQRLWQQYQVSRDVGGPTASLRVRFEERFIDHVDGVPVRVRLRAAVKFPLAATPWHFTLANEAFLGLNDTARSQQDGFHENRAYAGFGRRISSNAVAQIGYQNQFLDGRTRDRMIHQLFIGLAFTAP